MNAKELRELLNRAYKAGWEQSGEGWNAEYPGDWETSPNWQSVKEMDIDKILNSLAPDDAEDRAESDALASESEHQAAESARAQHEYEDRF